MSPPQTPSELRPSTRRSLASSALIALAFFGAIEAVLWWVEPAPPVRPRLLRMPA